MVAMNKVSGQHTFLTLRLQLQQLQGRARAPSAEQPVTLDRKFAGRDLAGHDLAGHGSGRQHLQVLAAKRRECAWPGLEAAKPITNLLWAAMKIDAAIFSLKYGGQSRGGVVLGTRVSLSGLQSAERFDHQVSADSRQSGR